MVRHASNNGEIFEVVLDDQLAPDVKRALTAAVAQQLHRMHGGNAVLDWLEAEMLVQDVFRRDVESA